MLRQQAEKPSANLCLSDYVAEADSGVDDWAGLFAVTTGIGLEDALEQFPETDDYSRILLQSMADRLWPRRCTRRSGPSSGAMPPTRHSTVGD